MKRLSLLTLCVAVLGLVAPVLSQWEEYPGNPVFGQLAGGQPAYFPNVLYDEDLFSGHGVAAPYLMWYGTTLSRIGLAWSLDGIIWNDLGVVMAGFRPNVEYFPSGFSGMDSGDNPSSGLMYFRIWYWSGILNSVNAVRYAESPDGINWYNDQAVQNGTVPIITGTSPDWNRGSFGPSDILYNPSATNTGTDWVFTMYYEGTNGSNEAIGLGFSSDGIVWTGYDGNGDGKADPVLTGTFVSGDWDRCSVGRATIIKNADDDYEMWYSGGIAAINEGIGYASSADGIHWERNPENLIFHESGGPFWRSGFTYCPSVIKQDGSCKMWYAGTGAGLHFIGYASKPDPVRSMPSVTEMALFSIEKAKIDFKTNTGEDKIDIKGNFELGEDSDGVNVLDAVTVTIGSFSETIILSARENDSKWEYRGPIDGQGVKDMKIDWKKSGALFHVKIRNVDLGEMSSWSNPVTISLQIGDDRGTVEVLMTEHKYHWDY